MNSIKQFLLAIHIFPALTFQDHGLVDGATTRDIIVPKMTEWHVTVVNGLTPNETLFIHCKSKEDDLGEVSLMFKDRFSWRFRQNILHSTLFWCYIRKDYGHMNVKVFWNDVILFHRCGWERCVWTAKTNGLYLWNSATGEDVLSEIWKDGW